MTVGKSRQNPTLKGRGCASFSEMVKTATVEKNWNTEVASFASIKGFFVKSGKPLVKCATSSLYSLKSLLNYRMLPNCLIKKMVSAAAQRLFHSKNCSKRLKQRGLPGLFDLLLGLGNSVQYPGQSWRPWDALWIYQPFWRSFAATLLSKPENVS